MPLIEHKKRLLILFCSPNPHGCTRMLLDSFLEVFRERKDWLVEEIDTYQLNPGPAPKGRPAGSAIWTPLTNPCAAATCWPWPLRCITTPSPRP